VGQKEKHLDAFCLRVKIADEIGVCKQQKIINLNPPGSARKGPLDVVKKVLEFICYLPCSDLI
jgi:hypothetical protein